LDEAYADPRPITDTGIVQRTLENSILCAEIFNYFEISAEHRCLDFGGGNGLFSRMMRDRGYDFFCYDRYATSFYVPHHVATEHDIKQAVVVTCFEVLEHLPNPAKELNEIFAYQPDILIASSSLYNGQGPEWPYLSVENGQHVFFYSAHALGMIAQAYGYHLVTTGSLHVFLRHQSRSVKITDDQYCDFGRIINLTSIRKRAFINFFYAMNNSYQHVQKDHVSIISKITANTNEKPVQIAPLRDNARGYRTQPHGVDKRPIIIDGVFFQCSGITGIARVWKEILLRWAGTPFADRLILLDRAGTLPPIPGIRRIVMEPMRFSAISAERRLLQRYCDHFDASVFISTYYSMAETTPSVMLVHDMIPDRLPGHFNLEEDTWQEKNALIAKAKKFVCISNNTRADLLELHPNLDPDTVSVAYLGTGSAFRPQSDDDIQAVLKHYRIDRPYLLFVGVRCSYKNPLPLIEAWKNLPEQDRPLVVFVGGGPLSDDILQELGEHSRQIAASDEILAVLYSGALALVFPSLYEGFGLPVLEAMACGCPVICSKVSSLPEVAGGAALLISPHNPLSITAAILRLQDPATRERFIKAGLDRAAVFSWDIITDELRIVLESFSAESSQRTISKSSDQLRSMERSYALPEP
jgi:glycosyltransferase involved in cell wall biosynthesis